MSGPIDKISWLAEIFISQQGGGVLSLLVWSVAQSSLLVAGCVSPPVVLVWSASRLGSSFSLQLSARAEFGWRISPNITSHSSHNTPSSKHHCVVWANFCSGLRSSVADWDPGPGPGLTQFYKIEPGGNPATQCWTKWIDTDFL